MDIADRGADIFEASGRAGLGPPVPVRATQDRKIRRGPEPTDKAAYRSDRPARCPLCLQHSRGPRPRGPTRTHGEGANGGNQGLGPGPGDLEGPSSRVGTDPGVGRAGLGAEPPAGVEEPLEWILLSSLPVQTEEELLHRQAWYDAAP